MEWEQILENKKSILVVDDEEDIRDILESILFFEGYEVTLAAESPALGKEIAGIGLPRESTVVALLRDGHVVVPRGDTVLRQGDEVLVLVTGESEDDVRRLLVG